MWVMFWLALIESLYYEFSGYGREKPILVVRRSRKAIRSRNSSTKSVITHSLPTVPLRALENDSFFQKETMFLRQTWQREGESTTAGIDHRHPATNVLSQSRWVNNVEQSRSSKKLVNRKIYDRRGFLAIYIISQLRKRYWVKSVELLFES